MQKVNAFNLLYGKQLRLLYFKNTLKIKAAQDLSNFKKIT